MSVANRPDYIWYQRRFNVALAPNMIARDFITAAGRRIVDDRVIRGELAAGSTAFLWLDPSDLTTMFQDSAGATPVTAPAQPVGLVLDKSQGLVLGPELFSRTLNFADAGWSKQAAVTSSGPNTFTTNAQGGVFAAFFSASTSRYRIRITGNTTASLVVRNDTSLTGAITIPAGTFDTTFNSQLFTDSGGIFFQLLAAGTAVITSFSVRELPGFHASQSTAASRPTYGVVPSRGRVNLLTFTEQFDNAAWVRFGTVSVTANSAISPDGAQTADTVAISAGSGIFQTVTALPLTTYTASVWIRADSNVTGRLVVNTNLSDPVFQTINATTQWQRVSLSKTTQAGTTGVSFQLDAGNGANTIYVWGAQLETGSTATTYQRVVSQFDVTDPVGFPSYPCHYLSFDGVDDFLVTPTITPNADKVQVFAGVRKLSDAAAGGVVAEVFQTLPTPALASLLAPPPSAANTYRFANRGPTAIASALATSASSYVSPVTNILTGLGDIAGDNAILRIDGSQAAQSSTDMGTGVYPAMPIYIGRRGGTTLPATMQLFQLIFRFSTANLDAGLVSQTERFVGQKTGVTIA